MAVLRYYITAYTVGAYLALDDDDGFLVVPDANTLLDILAGAKDYAEPLLSIYEGLEDRLVIPSRVKIEFDFRKAPVLQQRENALKRALQLAISQIGKDGWDTFEEHQILTELLEQHTAAQPTSRYEGRLSELFRLRTVEALTDRERAYWETEFPKRFAADIPPGHNDGGKCGDLLVFRETINISTLLRKSVLFVTEDHKDWASILSGQTIPAAGLQNEFARDTGGKLFHLAFGLQVVEMSATRESMRRFGDTLKIFTQPTLRSIGSIGLDLADSQLVRNILGQVALEAWDPIWAATAAPRVGNAWLPGAFDSFGALQNAHLFGVLGSGAVPPGFANIATNLAPLFDARETLKSLGVDAELTRTLFEASERSRNLPMGAAALKPWFDTTDAMRKLGADPDIAKSLLGASEMSRSFAASAGALAPYFDAGKALKELGYTSAALSGPLGMVLQNDVVSKYRAQFDYMDPLFRASKRNAELLEHLGVSSAAAKYRAQLGNLDPLFRASKRNAEMLEHLGVSSAALKSQLGALSLPRYTDAEIAQARRQYSRWRSRRRRDLVSTLRAILEKRRDGDSAPEMELDAVADEAQPIAG